MWLRQVYHLMELRRNQWLKSSEIQEIQRKRLRAIIEYAYHNIEFYHEKLKAVGVKPDDIRTLNDLPKLPTTTKSEVREGFRRGSILRKGLNLSRCKLARTSGSSGDPMTIVYDEKAEDFQKAVAIRSFMEAGGRYRDKWVMITSPQRAAAKKRWFQRFGLFSPIYLSLFDSADTHVSMLRKIKPDIIQGYSSSLELIARAIHEKGISDIKPRVVIGTAEVLSDEVRRFINTAFNLKMFDQFGGVEIGRSAWECEEHSGYHMDVDALAMEFVKNNEHVAHGERGRLLYTSLYNYAMPLIRYDVGDVCVPTDELCPCGRGLPLMKHIEGRVDDFVVTPSGRIFSPIIWTIMMRDISGIAQFKILQKTKRDIIVQMVKDSGFSSATQAQIRDRIANVLGEEIEVGIELVEEIPKDKAGKIRSVVSEVRIDW